MVYNYPRGSAIRSVTSELDVEYRLAIVGGEVLASSIAEVLGTKKFVTFEANVTSAYKTRVTVKLRLVT